MKTTGQDIKEFIKNYDKINYCEAIIYADGTIEEAIPSHTHKLCEIYDNTKTISEIEKEIPINVTPINWLMSKCNCISLYYNFFIINEKYQEITNEQKNTLRLLQAQEIINVPDLEESFILISNTYKEYQDLLNKTFTKEKIEEIKELLYIKL